MQQGSRLPEKSGARVFSNTSKNHASEPAVPNLKRVDMMDHSLHFRLRSSRWPKFKQPSFSRKSRFPGK
jgi:hypothetical protein